MSTCTHAHAVLGHATAMTRKKASVPMRHLGKHGLLRGTKLDFGSGKGTDAHIFDMHAFDPYHDPAHQLLVADTYHTITCNYVLNVVDVDDRTSILHTIQRLLVPQGQAYITVRRDLPAQGRPGRKCYQHYVLLDLPVIYETRAYCIYGLNKYSVID